MPVVVPQNVIDLRLNADIVDYLGRNRKTELVYFCHMKEEEGHFPSSWYYSCPEITR